MQGKDFIIGTLKSSGCLKTKSEEILLTKIPTQAAQSPESVALVWQSASISPKTVVKNKIKHMKVKLLACLIRNVERM